jgi:hypothetical protein
MDGHAGFCREGMSPWGPDVIELLQLPTAYPTVRLQQESPVNRGRAEDAELFDSALHPIRTGAHRGGSGRGAGAVVCRGAYLFPSLSVGGCAAGQIECGGVCVGPPNPSLRLR